ncbi:hypothetical protein PRZ61_02990 [Halomonas pacifica]|uniref:hypothetical protein n=1 Tax=Bisbaumannia pacifica TaxID=77098 RepID=UPI002358CCF3|nr:hypothetical protein [Halomonas pacifica]MDC8802420.1 hypothetical protein [Halomonas pacifica]
MKKFRSFFYEFLGVIFGVAILNVWYLSSVAVEEGVVPKSYDYIINGFIIVVGAFIGSFSAFWLKKYEEEKADKKRRVSVLNASIFIMVRQLNAIHGFKNNFSSCNSSFERAFSMPALKPPDYSSLKLDLEGLYFFIDSGAADLLLRLSVEQERFEQCVSALEIRNDFYVNEVQPALSYYSLNGRPLPLSEFEEKLGERIFHGAVNGAENLYELVSSSERTLPAMIDELRRSAKDMFPEEKFVAWGRHEVQT